MISELSASPRMTANRRERASDAKAREASRRVLIVVDEPDVAAVMRQHLLKEG